MIVQNADVQGLGSERPSELQRAFRDLRQGYQRETYPTLKTRSDRLDRLWDALDSHSARLCEALSADFGYRSPRQSYFADVATTGKSIRLARKGIKRWMRPDRRSVELPFKLFGARAEVIYQPLGVAGILSPWNVPVNLTLTPLAGVLAAGNRALVKPSEYTPHTAAVMSDMLGAAFSTDEVQVVTGGADVGQAFSQLPFDHLVFTGGESIAKHIMRAAAEHLTPLTLELGGKSPVIIGPTAELELAAKRIVFGKVFNAGQVCLAPDYVLVDRSKRDALVALIRQEIARALPDGIRSPDFVSVVNQRQGDRIRRYISEAKAAGAEVIGDPVDLTNGNLIPITLIVDPPENLAVSREEIFGPILVIRSCDSIDDAIAYVNARPRALALYYFGRDAAEQKRVIERTASGGVTINDVIMHYTIDDLPFGGVGPSGMGAYHGYDGFRQFSNARSVYRQARADLGRIIRPPYGKLFDRFSQFTMRHG
jgi:coniferyl-aldehyde dehydrogenase